MRDIKFRGKEENSGEWVYGYYCRGGWIDPMSGIETPRHIIHAEYLFDVDPDTIGQFTGMRDKNGQKIFEGDILRLRDEESVDVGVVRYNEDFGKYIVVYSQVSGNWFDFEGAYGELLGCFYSEVIGNIYDNPELLEKE